MDVLLEMYNLNLMVLGVNLESQPSSISLWEINMYVYLFICIYECIYVCMYVYLNMCVCAYTYLSVSVYVYSKFECHCKLPQQRAFKTTVILEGK